MRTVIALGVIVLVSAIFADGSVAPGDMPDAKRGRAGDSGGIAVVSNCCAGAAGVSDSPEASAAACRRMAVAAALFPKVDMSDPTSFRTVRQLLEVVSYSREPQYLDVLRKSGDAFMKRLAAMSDEEVAENREQINDIWEMVQRMRQTKALSEDCRFFEFLRKFRAERGL